MSFSDIFNSRFKTRPQFHIRSEGNNVHHYIISYLAAVKLGYTGTKIAAALRLTEKSISRCIDRGKKLVDNDKKTVTLSAIRSEGNNVPHYARG